MQRALYSGSFDPITYGHLDIIDRASKIFDLKVVVGDNPTKSYLFSIEERVAMIRQVLKDKNIQVIPIQNKLIADYAYENGIHTIIKGIRGIKDYDYERMMREVNLTQQRGIDTHILLAKRELEHISSSAVKELCRYQGFIHNYVPLNVKEALERRINGQIVVGLTGGIASGKSYVAKRIVMNAESYGIEMYNIDLDEIAHDVMFARQEPVYKKLNEDIRSTFGLKENVSRKELGDIVFSDPEKLRTLNKMVRTPILTRMRSLMSSMKGIILLNTAILVEADMLSMCNNNVIVVTAEPWLQRDRLKKRGLNSTQIDRRLNSQISSEDRIQRIKDKISSDGWGYCEIIDCRLPFPHWGARKFRDIFKFIGGNDES